MVSRCWFALVASLLLPVPGSDGGEATPQTPGKETKGSVGKPLLVKAWRGTSPGKDAKEYETRLVKHLAGLNAPPSVALDRFGGWMAEKHDATGFFYAKKIGKRWWLVDPEGHLFLHMAVNSVSPGKSPQARRALPERFGTLEGWRDGTIGLLKQHGFNGSGSWSDDTLLGSGSQRLVYTPNLNFMSTYGKKRGGTFAEPGHTGYPNKCIFAFDPEFERFADEHARQLSARKDDPWLLGYFSDNEMPFPADSLDRYLKLGADDHGHREAKAWLAARRGGSDAKPITDEERNAWLGHVADRYFGVVRRAIRKYDPNHLYLGSRLYSSERNCPDVLRAAGKQLDVVAMNVYGVWTPKADTFERWTQGTGKPLVITEWYAKGADAGLPNTSGAGWTVATQRERGYFYQNFVLGLLETRAVVGWHWFKYADNDPEDTKAELSNRDSNKGIVTAAFQPHAPLLEAMGELNGVAYPVARWFDR